MRLNGSPLNRLPYNTERLGVVTPPTPLTIYVDDRGRLYFLAAAPTFIVRL